MKPKVIVLLVLLSLSIGYIMSTYMGAEESATFEQAEANPGDTYHITGFLVKDKPFEYDPMVDPNRFVFYLKDKKGNVRKVVSNEPKQQDFERAESVSMYGVAAEGYFMATKVIPKCPSKYKDEEANRARKVAQAAKS